MGLVLAVARARLSGVRPALPGETGMTPSNWLSSACSSRSSSSPRLLGRYMAKVFGDGPAPGDRVFRPVERVDLPRLRRRSRPRAAWTVYALSLLAFSVVSVLGLFVLQRVQGVAAAEPHRRAVGAAGTRVQHRRQLRDEHELAELLGRVDDEPPHADGRAHGAELRLCRRRARGRDRADPRTGPAAQRHDRQLLGRPDARPSASSSRWRSWSRSCS